MLRWQMIVLEKCSWRVHMEVKILLRYYMIRNTLLLCLDAHADVLKL